MDFGSDSEMKNAQERIKMEFIKPQPCLLIFFNFCNGTDLACFESRLLSFCCNWQGFFKSLVVLSYSEYATAVSNF